MKKVFFFVPVCLVLAGCFFESSVPSGDPRRGVITKIRGYKIPHDTMVATGGEYYWAQEVLSGYRRSRDSDVPSQIRTISQSTCSLKSPGAGAFVAHVHVSYGRQKAPVYEFSRRQVGDRAKRLIKSYVATKGRIKNINGYRGSDGLKLVNVAVAKSDKPVHLVLTSQSGVLWNIQKSDATEISGISVIGPRGAGLANVPEGTEVQGLFGRFLKSCKVHPARLPQEHWRFVEYATERSDRSTQRLLDRNYAAASAYSRWLLKTFGLADRAAVIDPMAVSNVLIGERPADSEQRIQYRPIKDAVVQISSNDYVFASTKPEYTERMTQLVTKAAERAIGGDLKLLLRGS
ncbi:MAG: hypothetical protein AAGD43_20545 [Pseudomonadota bacterium]